VGEIGAYMAAGLGLDTLFTRMLPSISTLVNAERSTLFLYDAAAHEIWSKAAQGDALEEIRLPVGRGIAGWVAQHHQASIVVDAYKDPRFSPEVDAKTGYRTRNLVAVPLMAKNGDLLGVLQVLNRLGGAFCESDVALVQAVAVQAAYAVENARQAQLLIDQNRELEAARQRAERRKAELDLLFQIEQETSESDQLDKLLDSVIVRACDRLRSEAGSVLIAQQDTGKLFFRGVTGDRQDELRQIVLEPGEGIVGWVAQQGRGTIVNRPEDDPRHDRNLAAKLDFPAFAILAVPLIWNRQVVGAVEVLNPKPRPTGAVGYDVEDLKLLTIIAGQIARAVVMTMEREARRDTERLAAIGQMLAGVVHDLRTPMTAVSGFAQLMAMDQDQNERNARCEKLLTQIDEMSAMLEDLLAFARGDSRLRPAQIEISHLVGEIRQALAATCESRGVTLSVEAKSDGMATIDVGRAKRIIFNLAKNAVDALSRGGTLTIDVQGTSDGIRLGVRDNGPGIPEPIRDKLFSPFVTYGKKHGTGLGLSIVKRFVEDHGGRITVTTAEHQGTTFEVFLPSIAPLAASREAP